MIGHTIRVSAVGGAAGFAASHFIRSTWWPGSDPWAVPIPVLVLAALLAVVGFITAPAEPRPSEVRKATGALAEALRPHFEQLEEIDQQIREHGVAIVFGPLPGETDEQFKARSRRYEEMGAELLRPGSNEASDKVSRGGRPPTFKTREEFLTTVGAAVAALDARGVHPGPPAVEKWLDTQAAHRQAAERTLKKARKQFGFESWGAVLDEVRR